MRSECYLAVLNREPQSQTNIARKYGVTRAAVSKIICKIKDELGIGGKYGQEGLTYKERFAKLKEKL
jgi:predicted transcriptional regulator